MRLLGEAEEEGARVGLIHAERLDAVNLAVEEQVLARVGADEAAVVRVAEGGAQLARWPARCVREVLPHPADKVALAHGVAAEDDVVVLSVVDDLGGVGVPSSRCLAGGG